VGQEAALQPPWAAALLLEGGWGPGQAGAGQGRPRHLRPPHRPACLPLCPAAEGRHHVPTRRPPPHLDVSASDSNTAGSTACSLER
jgi:hypothetical protein